MENSHAAENPGRVARGSWKALDRNLLLGEEVAEPLS